MRDAFARELVALAAEDPRLLLLSGDIGNRLFDPFKARFPERFFNCGVAEANMIGVAAGLASYGLRPIAYTIASFATVRCLEQIRVDLCYHELPVVVVGVGGGLSYASLGATHHSCEDLAFLRALPAMTVVCPGDPVEVRLALREACRRPGPGSGRPGPCYLRLGKKGEPAVHASEPPFRIGKALVVAGGERICLLSCGNVLPIAVEAGRALGAEVVSFHTVKPLDEEYLRQAFARFEVVATLEEHSVLGGLGGAVAEWLSEQGGARARLVRIGTPDRFLHEAGGQEHARRRFGLTAEAVVARLRDHAALG